MGGMLSCDVRCRLKVRPTRAFAADIEQGVQHRVAGAWTVLEGPDIEPQGALFQIRFNVNQRRINAEEGAALSVIYTNDHKVSRGRER